MRSFIGIVLICVVSAGDWSYKGPDAPKDWAENFAVCGGTSQSPINLNKEESTCGVGEGRPVWNFCTSCPGHLTNNGHSVQFDFPTPNPNTVKIGSSEYDVLQFHFHWGSDPTHKGSEHTEDGKHHQMEMHIVSKLKDGTNLSVLGFFVDVTNGADNAAFLPLTNALKNLKVVAVPVELTVDLEEMVAPAQNSHFYRYSGSLTTPPCSEIVTWTNYHTPLKISASQMQEFRNIGIVDNFRPVQPLDGRVLHNSAC